MNAYNLTHSTDESIKTVLEFANSEDTKWSAQDLAAILNHQLSAPLLSELKITLKISAKDVESLSRFVDVGIDSFGDLFCHPKPPLELLKMVKEYSKAHRGHPSCLLPKQICSVLYYVSIVMANVRCGERITTLDDSMIQEGLKWAINQDWIDENMQKVFLQGIEAFG